MFYIAFCDDSIEFRRIFRGALEKYCTNIFPSTLQYEIVNGFDNGNQVLEYLDHDPIDVLFLDIDMPGLTGFDLANKLLLLNKDIIIVFVSSHYSFVFDSFKFAPFDFLRKDKLLDGLPKTISRLSDKLDRANTYVKLQSVVGEITVSARDVVYISVEGNYYICHLNKDKITCRGTLSEAENLFSEFDFIRIHSAYMVNLYQVKGIEKYNVIVGSDYTILPIAQRRIAEFRHKYAKYNARSFHI